MPTILTHPAVPLAIALSLGQSIIPRRLLLAGVIASVLPDFDVLAFQLGIPYANDFGHRGFSHSLLLAIIIAMIGTVMHRQLHTSRMRSFSFLFVVAASHGFLDAFTTGGLGIAFFWPASSTRYFAPVQMIAVSPIGLSNFLSVRGVAVLKSELLWVWLPLLTAGLAAFAYRNRLSSRR
jgi:inner membrane protein